MEQKLPFSLELMTSELTSCRNIIDKHLAVINEGTIPGVNGYGDPHKFWTSMFRELLFSAGKLENLVNNVALDLNE